LPIYDRDGERGFASLSLEFILELQKRQKGYTTNNPPYLDSRDYNSDLKILVEREYPDSKWNLYSAFVERCLELLSDNGRLAKITGQSFMFISSFEDIRKKVLQTHAIETLAQFDFGLFKARVDTAVYVLRREPDADRRNASVGTYFRLVHEPDAESKRVAFERALAELKAAQELPSR
jgi:type I restriction-modification system DNA methylase subunit